MTEILFAKTTDTWPISAITALQAALDAKLPTASYTAADVLAKLLTVDGAASGLDADLLDGNSTAYFLARANHTGTQAVATISDLATIAAVYPTYRSVLGYIPTNLHAGIVAQTNNTDLTTYIQAALNAERALEFPAGDYKTGHLDIHDNVRAIRGPGRLVANGTITASTALVLATTHPGPLFIENLEININQGTYPTILGLYVNGGNDVTIQNVRANGYSAIKLETVDIVKVISCHIPTYVGNGIFVHDCNDTVIHDNTVIWNLGTAETGPGIYVFDGVGHSVCGNYLFHPSLFGILITDTLKAVVNGNRILGGYREGISVHRSSQWVVSNNVIVHDTDSIDFGLSIDGIAATCGAGIVSGNYIEAPSKQGIALAHGVVHVLVCDNVIVYPDVDNLDAEGAAILLYGPGCEQNTIINNHAFDNLGGMDYVVNEVTTSGTPNNNQIGPNFGSGYIVAHTKTVGPDTKVWDTDWITYAPTLAPTTGTFTTGATITRARYKRKGKEVEFSIHATLGNITGGSVALRVPLPVTALTHGGQARGTNVTTGTSFSGSCSGANCDMKLYDGTFPIASSDVIVLEGTYEAA